MSGKNRLYNLIYRERKYLLLFLFTVSYSILFSQNKAFLNKAILKSKLFAIAEFDQFDTLKSSLFKTSVVSEEGFKNVVFIKVEARNTVRLMLCAIGKKEDSLKVSFDSSSHSTIFDKAYRRYIFKKCYGYDSIDSYNLETVENLFPNDDFVNNTFGMECDYILAFTNNQCYLLKGFGNNQFERFFHDCIKSGYNVSDSIVSTESFENGKFLDLLDSAVRISEINLHDFYNYYVLHKQEKYPQCEPCTDMMILESGKW